MSGLRESGLNYGAMVILHFMMIRFLIRKKGKSTSDF